MNKLPLWLIPPLPGTNQMINRPLQSVIRMEKIKAVRSGPCSQNAHSSGKIINRPKITRAFPIKLITDLTFMR